MRRLSIQKPSTTEGDRFPIPRNERFCDTPRPIQSAHVNRHVDFGIPGSAHHLELCTRYAVPISFASPLIAALSRERLGRLPSAELQITPVNMQACTKVTWTRKAPRHPRPDPRRLDAYVHSALLSSWSPALLHPAFGHDNFRESHLWYFPALRVARRGTIDVPAGPNFLR